MAEKMKKVFNHSPRSFITSQGEFKPGKHIDLPVAEAENLAKAYPHQIKDKAAMFGDEAPASGTEIAKLKEEIRILQETVDANAGERAELEKLILAIDAEDKNAKGELKKLQAKLKKG